jgi:hypothetical protein
LASREICGAPGRFSADWAADLTFSCFYLLQPSVSCISVSARCSGWLTRIAISVAGAPFTIARQYGVVALRL